MILDNEEEEGLQDVARRNAESIFIARQRAEHELIRTKEALESAIEAKGRYVNMISHELRTPLGAIGGYAALLAEGIQGPLTEGQREYIERIRHNQAHIVRLVNELLDLAKIESGQFPLKLSAVPLLGVLKSAETMIEPQVRVRGLTLAVELCDSGLCLHADGERAQQIVLNLLSNAVKFTPSGGTVSVSSVTTSDAVQLLVQDTGVGIPESKLEAIFEPFFQVEQSETRAGTGTGLGLAISRELARAMGGDLTVESTPGEGSTFTLSLPRAANQPCGEVAD